ncbi:MAG: sensor histidine kinase [Chitinophagaceae bacterium]
MDKDVLIDKLIKKNDELENYFRNTIIPQLYIDADLNLQKFTPPAMKQFNLSRNDIGKSIGDITENLRFLTIKEDIQLVMESHEILEKDIQTTDFRWYQMNIIPYVRLEDNQTNGVIITFVETTMRIRDLREQEDLISEHETLLDSISHDIKNPLTSIMLIIDQLKGASLKLPRHFQSLFILLESSIRKMQHVIGDLTETRKGQHKYKDVVEMLNFENIMEDVRLLLSLNVSEIDAMIKYEIQVNEFTYSRRKLRSIIYNLVNNAIKFRSDDRQLQVLISTRKEDGFIVISVKDNGIGIDPQKQTAIFEKYFRMENHIEGSGIGLHLVKEMVTNSGGKIFLESQPGKGSEFKVFLKTQ